MEEKKNMHSFAQLLESICNLNLTAQSQTARGARLSVSLPPAVPAPAMLALPLLAAALALPALPPRRSSLQFVAIFRVDQVKDL